MFIFEGSDTLKG